MKFQGLKWMILYFIWKPLRKIRNLGIIINFHISIFPAHY
jgi:hypothetical protein